MIKLIIKAAMAFWLLQIFNPSVIAQSWLSKKAADAYASKALSNAIAKQKIIAAKEWSKGNNKIIYGNYTMPFDFITWGDKPADGRSLYISLHGGGSAPKEVNDQQWMNQHKLYQPSEGVYLVPRAPTDTWNLWHENHIDNMLEEIIKDAVAMAGVNPRKIYILGYSAGGDGVFQLAPRMADHWAAAAMMAGHPGDACALNLRNLPFAIYMGGFDSAYRRNILAAEWSHMLDSLQHTDTAGFIHDINIYPGLPHWMNRNDTIAISWLAGYRRNALPLKVDWVQDDRTRDNFYWLGAPAATAKARDTAIVSIKNNTVDIEYNNCEELYIYLNDRMLDLDKQVTVSFKGNNIFSGRLKRSESVIAETAKKRMDADLIFSVKVMIKNGAVIL